MLQKIIVCLSIAIHTHSIFGQAPQGTPTQGNTKLYIRGSVVEAQNDQPIEYASVAIYNSSDSTTVSGGITDATGKFDIEIQRPGLFYLIIHFIGYEKYTLTGLSLSPQTPSISLKPIKLSPTAITLEGVTVTERKNEVIFKIDKKVIQVADNPNAVGNTAVEVLEATPGVDSDSEGNITLRGSENFTVLINGKPTVLTGNDALQQIPASSIENIEIITNPSAKYDPEGLTGIINIILKKDEKAGLNGLVDLSAGNFDRYSASLNMNYRKSIHSFTIGYDFNKRSRGGKNHSERKTMTDTDTLDRLEDGRRDNSRQNHNVRLGYEVDLSKKSSLSLNGLYRIGSRGGKNTSNLHQYFFSRPDSIESIYTESNNDNSRSDYDINATFLHKFDDDGHELLIMASLSGEDEDSFSRRYRKIFPDSTSEYNDTARNNEFFKTLQIDYTRNFGKFRFETGWHSRFRDIDFFNTTYQSSAIAGKDPVPDDFEYSDAVHSLYLMSSVKIKSWEIQAGLRGEYARIETFQKSNNEQNLTEIPSLFPTLHLSQTMGENKFMLSYSRRITRPRIWIINPYEEFTDSYNVMRGNPEVDPEYSNAFEFNYLRYFNQSSLSGTAFYRQTDNSISRVSRMYNPESNDMIMLTTFDNLGKQSSLGIELSFRHSLFKWWQIDGFYSFYRFNTEGELNGRPYNNTSNNQMFRVNSVFRITPNIDITAYGMYMTPSVTAQGKRGDFFNNGVSYRHHLFEKRGTFTVSVRNPVGKMRWEFWSSDVNFDNYSYMQPDMPMITVGFSYRINEGVKRNRATSEERVEEYSDEMDM